MTLCVCHAVVSGSGKTGGDAKAKGAKKPSQTLSVLKNLHKHLMSRAGRWPTEGGGGKEDTKKDKARKEQTVTKESWQVRFTPAMRGARFCMHGG